MRRLFHFESPLLTAKDRLGFVGLAISGIQ